LSEDRTRTTRPFSISVTTEQAISHDAQIVRLVVTPEDQRLFDLIMSQLEPKSVKGLLRLHISIYLEFVRSNLDLHAALINDVPQFAVGQEELPLYKDYVPWATKFLNLR